MPINTRNQRYAETIYDQVQRVSADQRADYQGMAQKLPILIHTAGLAQAVAFVESRGGAGHQLLNDLADVVGTGTRATLLRRSRTDDLHKYMRLTQEVLTALLWYKRFGQTSAPEQAQTELANDAGRETNPAGGR